MEDKEETLDGICDGFSSPSADECGKLKPNERIEDNNDKYAINGTIKVDENPNEIEKICPDLNFVPNNNFTSFDLENQGNNHELGTRKLYSTKFIDFYSLPDVVVLKVLSFLDIKCLGRVACVSKYLNACCQYASLWTHLNLSSRRLVTDDVLYHVISISSNITSLDISESRNITEHGLRTALVDCITLQKLKAVRCECITDTSLETIGQFCVDLNMVDFSMCKITDLGIEKFCSGCTKLQQIKLDHCRQLTSKALTHIANNCRELQWLSVENDIEIHDDGVNELVTACHELKRLQLNSCRITGESIRSIAMHAHALTVLDVRYCTTLNDDLVKELVCGCPDLVILNLSLCFNVTDQSAVHISQYCTRLKSIYLVNCRITDQGMKTFSHSTFGLEWIDVSWCQDITDDGVRTLVYGCKTLKHLGLVRCDLLTNTTIQGLCHQFPSLYISTLLTEMDRLTKKAEISENTLN